MNQEGAYRSPLGGRSSTAWAFIAVATVLSWQAATVGVNYGGNWSGLFRIGSARAMPQSLSGKIIRSAHRNGYDGQFFLVIAHDPLLRGDTLSYLDSPALRSRRILVPLAAWILAAGQKDYIVPAFIAILLAAVFGGVYWTSKLMALQGRPPAFGLLFLAVPATLIGVDSMTVDLAVAALTAFFIWQWTTGSTRAMWITLAAAALVRETALLLTVAVILAEVRNRNWKRAVVWATAALPALFWYIYVAMQVSAAAHLPKKAMFFPYWLLEHIEVGLLIRLFIPHEYKMLDPSARLIAQMLDVLALAAMGVAIGYAAVRIRRVVPPAVQMLLAVHVLFAVLMMNRDFWANAYGYARPFGPLYMMLLTTRASTAGLLASVLLAGLIDLRILAEYFTQVLGIWRWLSG